jgi:phosphoribosylaminoimidazolecarboxamide formyltransferase/IMP cyclohydrolase
MNSTKIQNALFSVSNKDGLTELARGLAEVGISLYASGGTRKHLEQAGLEVTEVAAYTGFPEMMDGRIKTLHPKIHGGILCRTDHPADMASLAEHGIVPFGLVVANLYPFEQTIARDDVSIPEAIEQIDIGGPTLVRAAAKNHAYTTIACDPSQYGEILKQVQTDGATTPEFRRQLAGAAFAHTSLYDTAIANYFRTIQTEPAKMAGLFNTGPAKMAGLSDGTGAAASAACENTKDFPPHLSLSATQKTTLRYGENPHQSAALYELTNAGPHSLVRAEQLNGKELSYNNLLDLDAALAVARSLPEPGVAVLKHNNPCGAATGHTLGEAMQKAWDGDPVSAFGSILGFNVPVDAAAAECLAEPGKFIEAIVGPDFEPDALGILITKPKWKANVRLLKVGKLTEGRGEMQLRAIDGGYLAQQADDLGDDESEWHVITDTKPTAIQMADLRFAWAVCRHVKSNAILLARDESLVGVGAGQMSRVDAVETAIRKAGDRASGAVLASDAFFPFDDSIHAAADAGVAAVIQPGGSKRDEEVIAACNQHGLPMIFTGRRHFRH